MTIYVKSCADLRQTSSRMSWKSCHWNIRKWDFPLKDSKMQMTEPALPHGACVSYSAVEVKGMQPDAMNFSDRTTSIYVFILRKACNGGGQGPGDEHPVKTEKW